MDPYKTLGLDKSCSDEEIKKSFKKLSKKFHPDKVQGKKLKKEREEKMQEITAAYSILKDKEKRKLWDKTGTTEKEKTVDELAIEMFNLMVSNILRNDKTTYENFYRKLINEVESSLKSISKDVEILEKRIGRYEDIKSKRCIREESKYLKNMVWEGVKDIKERIYYLKGHETKVHNKCKELIQKTYYIEEYDGNRNFKVVPNQTFSYKPLHNYTP